MNTNADIQDMPQLLVDILQEITPVKSNIHAFNTEWHSCLRFLQNELPELNILDDGDTVCLGEMSPGCVRCKNGEWDCLFMTPACNLNCSFCISPFQNRRVPVSAYGQTPAQVIENYKTAGITGISFSGGEPFLEFQNMLRWFQSLKHNLPLNYFWLYTNGLLVGREQINLLADLGINEMRFNTAASGYRHKSILKLLEYAAHKIQNVTVEIPLVRRDLSILITALQDYESAGVKFINVHELLREEKTLSEQMQNETFQTVVFPDGHVTDVSLDSRTAFQKIAKNVVRSKMSLCLNFCSTVNKIRQIKNRRQNMLRLQKKQFEKIVDNEYLLTVFAYRDKNTWQWVHPDEWAEKSDRYLNYSAHRLKKIGPLSVWDKGRYMSAEKIREKHVVSSASVGKM